MCGLANQRGGFFVVGVRRERGRWIADGVDFGGEEPTVWLSGVIARGVDPVPLFDVKTWSVKDGKHVAVVSVDPIAVPPCVTSAGQVYERLPGRTEPASAETLTRLIRRGERARRDARILARSRVRGLIESGHMRSPERLRVCLGLRATGYEYDISSRLFMQPNVQAIIDAVKPRLRPDRYTEQSRVTLDLRQDAVAVETLSGDLADDNRLGGDHLWRVWASWGGAVAIRCSANDAGIGIQMLTDDILRPAWSTAAEIVPLIGGFGSGHLVVEIAGEATLAPGRDDWVPEQIDSSTVIQRALPALDPDEIVIEGIQRELMRAVGYRVWEPEPEAGSEPVTEVADGRHPGQGYHRPLWP